ncbi:MAG: hypothetical protein K2G04_05140, partial [Oscillospiraceae bacterium]|nr:hypothetical protein [Oscillospiraceae bacterium]
MIGVTVNHEGNTLLMSLPTDELYDHLGSIEINKDIPIGGTEDIDVKFYADNDLEISQTVCGRRLHDDKISRVNELCEQIESALRVGYTETNKAFVERGLRGVEAMSAAVPEMDIRAREEIEQELK